jgi:hypothetical protein
MLKPRLNQVENQTRAERTIKDGGLPPESTDGPLTESLGFYLQVTSKLSLGYRLCTTVKEI